MKKTLLSFMLVISTAFLTLTACAEPKPGREFAPVQQVIPTDNPKKIEVMELFWYGCGHCYHMEAPLKTWLKTKPADVTFKRVPAVPNPSWAPMAKAYFTMESLGVLDKLHHSAFEAIHKSKTLNPRDEKGIINWIANKSGKDRAEVEKTFKSFTINTNLNRAASIFRSSGATGVPSLVIDGKYRTSGTMAGGNSEALMVTDYIIENVRKTKGK